jgi:hypothetical protein
MTVAELTSALNELSAKLAENGSANRLRQVRAEQAYAQCTTTLDNLKKRRHATLGGGAGTLTLKSGQRTIVLTEIVDDEEKHDNRLFLPGTAYTCAFPRGWEVNASFDLAKWSTIRFTPVNPLDHPVPNFYDARGSAQDVPFVIWRREDANVYWRLDEAVPGSVVAVRMDASEVTKVKGVYKLVNAAQLPKSAHFNLRPDEEPAGGVP